jgi:thiamine-phosphate pyrophosphorylase
LWLLSDERNDAALADALRQLPRNSGFIYRHYHLPDTPRRERFDQLAAAARIMGHWVILSCDPETAKAWHADGIYGPPERLADAPGLIRLAAVHNEAEIAAANQINADAVLLSPVFPTRSHPGAASLGPARFRQLAALTEMPVIALGGMTRETAKKLDWPRWAAIDGLVSPKDS